MVCFSFTLSEECCVCFKKVCNGHCRVFTLKGLILFVILLDTPFEIMAVFQKGPPNYVGISIELRTTSLHVLHEAHPTPYLFKH